MKPRSMLNVEAAPVFSIIFPMGKTLNTKGTKYTKDRKEA
jgi:hypothetical protein